MPRQVSIPDVGVVAFPDSMSDEQIVSTIKQNHDKWKADRALDATQSVRPPKEGMIDSALHNVKIGFKSAASDLEHTGANAIRPFSKGNADWLEQKSKETAPSQEEIAERQGMSDSILQGIGGLPVTAVKYLPAIAAGRAGPLVAGLEDAVGASDQGWKAAAKAGISTAVGFELRHQAGKLPTRLTRAAGSAAALGGAAAFESGGDMRKAGAAAVLGAGMGAFGPKAEGKSEIADKAKEVYTSTKDDIQKVFSPDSRSEDAAKSARIARAHLAEMAQRADRAEYSLRKARSYFEGQKIDPVTGTSQAGLDFIDASETGRNRIADPELRAQADAIHKMFDDRFDKLEKAGLLQSYVDNYFPRAWARPDKVNLAYAEIGKRPFEGTKSFTRQRRFASVKEGLDYAKANPESGLKLADANPIDTVLRKLRDMDKLLMSKDVMKEMKEQGILKFFKDGEKRPPGYKKIDDKISTVQFRKDGMRTIAGEWHGPAAAVDILNNYLAPGWKDKAWFRGATGLANVMNQAQLGLSAFHLGKVTYESLMGNFALGAQKIVHGIGTGEGRFLKDGVQDWLKAAPRAIDPIIDTARNNKSIGNKVWNEWMNPGSHPEIAHLVQYAKEGGARVQMDPYYRTQLWRNMKRSWVNGHKSVAALRALPAVSEAVMRPIMEDFVPRQKIALFSRMAEFEMEKLGKNATQDDIRKAMQTAWNSTDNRMGQLVYDNKFWNPIAKNLAQLGVRSVGWNWGTYAELGGGTYDAAKLAKALITNKGNKEFTARMAYTVTFPIMTGLIGAMTTKVMTGENPKDWRDFFEPRTGGKDEYGRDNRVSLPSYANDIISAWQHITREGPARGIAKVASGKVHPMLGTILDMMANRDWQGNYIWDPEGNIAEKSIAGGEYVAKSFTPIAWQSSLEDASKQKGVPDRYSKSQKALAMVGVRPATSAVTKTEAEAYLDQFSDEHRTPNISGSIAEKRFGHIRDLESMYRHKIPDDQIDKITQEWIDKGEIDAKGMANARQRADESPLIRRMEHTAQFDPKNSSFTALKAYELALYDDSIPPEDMEKIRDIVQKKINAKIGILLTRPKDDRVRQRVLGQIHKLGLEAPLVDEPDDEDEGESK